MVMGFEEAIKGASLVKGSGSVLSSDSVHRWVLGLTSSLVWSSGC